VVIENKILEGRIMRSNFGPRIEEVSGGWGKLHNEKHHKLYQSHIAIRI
jgi:hypothetical protein